MTRSSHIHHSWPHVWTPCPLLLNFLLHGCPGGSFHLKQTQPSTDFRVHAKPPSLAPDVDPFVVPPSPRPCPSSPLSPLRPYQSILWAIHLHTFRPFFLLAPEHPLPQFCSWGVPTLLNHSAAVAGSLLGSSSKSSAPPSCHSKTLFRVDTTH